MVYNWPIVVSLLVSFLRACSKASRHLTSSQDWTCVSSELLGRLFCFFNIDLMLFFNIDLMLKMQLLGTPPNSNRCTGGAPNRASSLQVLPCAVSFSQHFRRVAFGDPLRSFRNSFVMISMVLNTFLDKCCPPPRRFLPSNMSLVLRKTRACPLPDLGRYVRPVADFSYILFKSSPLHVSPCIYLLTEAVGGL